MYLTYEEFKAMGGAGDLPTFLRNEFKARKQIDYYTANRVSEMREVPFAVKACMFELIRLDNLYDVTLNSYDAKAQSGENIAPVASFSTDGYQETYGGASTGFGEYLANARKGIGEAQKDAIFRYLEYEYDDNNVKLLYRGVY